MADRAGRTIDDELVAQLATSGEYGRAHAAHARALALAHDGPTPQFRQSRQRASDLFVEGSAWWFLTLQTGMAVELAAGNLCEALELADLDLEHAHRIADRSAMMLPLAGYALALRQVGDVDTAAVVRGCLPRRLTVMLEDELVELDAWLAAHLDESNRLALAERGATMEPRAVRDVARTAIDPHLTAPT
jgi:hypothetical protein